MAIMGCVKIISKYRKFFVVFDHGNGHAITGRYKDEKCKNKIFVVCPVAALAAKIQVPKIKPVNLYTPHVIKKNVCVYRS